MTVLIATGMKREARLMAAPGVVVVAGGGDNARLERDLEAIAGKVDLLVSSGLAGALDPLLVPGDVVLDGPAELVERLCMALPMAHVGPVLGSDMPVATTSAKALAGQCGAIAVDMESHVAREVAARHGVPCVVIRVISDSADQALPPAALAALRPDGGIALGALFASLLRQPRQLPALIRTGRDAQIAFRALDHLHHMLRVGGAGGFDLRQLALNM